MKLKPLGKIVKSTDQDVDNVALISDNEDPDVRELRGLSPNPVVEKEVSTEPNLLTIIG